jgi:hypothetical protein
MAVFGFIQLGWLKSKSEMNSEELMNIFISTTLLLSSSQIHQIFTKRGIANFLLLPSTLSEKFTYAFINVFIGAFAFSFLIYPLVELSSRMLFSVSHEWFAFDVDFTAWMVFTVTILFYFQFLIFYKISTAMLVVVYIAFVLGSAYLDNYFTEHFAQFSPIRLMIYALLSVGFISASYLQFSKCESTFRTKSLILK